MKRLRRGSLATVIALTGLTAIAFFASPAGAKQAPPPDATTFDRIDAFRTPVFVYLFLRSRRPAGGRDTLAPEVLVADSSG